MQDHGTSDHLPHVGRKLAELRHDRFLTVAAQKGLLISRQLLSRARKQAVPVTKFG